jgi:hypothetical protein
MQLSCVGYPLGLEANDAGFPILRTGVVASYPLTPINDFPTFMYNFDVFGGNSGGPVYIYSLSRAYGRSVHFEALAKIMGIVVEEVSHIDVEESIRGNITETVREQKVTKIPLAISIVVQAQFVKDLIDSLPEP